MLHTKSLKAIIQFVWVGWGSLYCKTGGRQRWLVPNFIHVARLMPRQVVRVLLSLREKQMALIEPLNLWKKNYLDFWWFFIQPKSYSFWSVWGFANCNLCIEKECLDFKFNEYICDIASDSKFRSKLYLMILTRTYAPNMFLWSLFSVLLHALLRWKTFAIHATLHQCCNLSQGR